MGNIGQLASMIPGLNSNVITKEKEKESTAKIQRFLAAMDSMHKDELDGIKPLCEGRIKRIARGAGVHVSEIHFLMNEHKKMSGMVKQVGSLTNMAGGGMDMESLKKNPKQAQQMLQNLQKNMDPEMMKQMGGMQGMMNMAKQMQGSGRGGMPDMGKMMQMMQGGGAGAGGGAPPGGMPPGMPGMPGGGDMAGMMQMA